MFGIEQKRKAVLDGLTSYRNPFNKDKSNHFDWEIFIGHINRLDLAEKDNQQLLSNLEWILGFLAKQSIDKQKDVFWYTLPLISPTAGVFLDFDILYLSMCNQIMKKHCNLIGAQANLSRERSQFFLFLIFDLMALTLGIVGILNTVPFALFVVCGVLAGLSGVGLIGVAIGMYKNKQENQSIEQIQNHVQERLGPTKN